MFSTWPTLMQLWIFRMRSSPRCALVLTNNLVNWLVEKKVSEWFSVPLCSPFPLFGSIYSFTGILKVGTFTQTYLVILQVYTPSYGFLVTQLIICIVPPPLVEHEVKHLYHYKVLKNLFWTRLTCSFSLR